ncbi:MAG: gamma-glutamyltransferase, partial [Saprospiraceae bacterium]|nr:gamma-glutamyltransferase [Saprospiraceae bacterium]
MRNPTFSLLVLFIIACALPTCKSTVEPVINNGKQIKVKKHAVVSAHPFASEAAYKILEQGGNAIDAAIAMQFALAVTFPTAGNIGGGGFAVVYTADGQALALDFREKAPKLAFEEMYLDKQGDPIKDASLIGH